MARRKDYNEADELSLDSLMDILTCSVGVMLIVVVLSVLDARGSSINLALPFARQAPSELDRKLMVIDEGQIRFWNLNGAVAHFESGGEVTFESLPKLVRKANAAEFTDGYYEFSYELKEESYGWNNLRRWLEIESTLREDASAFTLENLEDDPSAFVAMVSEFGTSEDYWVSFQVSSDTASIEAFRFARNLLAEQGVTTGWDPNRLDFPDVQTVYRSGGSSGPRSAGSTVTN